MRWQDLPIVGGSYRDDTRPWSVQDTVNLIPVRAERQGTRSPAILRGAPGLVVFSSGAQSAPCRGLHNVEGTLFGVVGDKLYTWGTDGTAVALAGIPGVERVSMAHNQIASGNQLVIAANGTGYVWNTSNSTFQQITDDGFPGAKAFAFMDGHIVGINPSGDFAYSSALADALSYSTLDQFQAEAEPDKIMGLVATHEQLWLFGARTVQPFSDTGAAQSPFASDSNMAMEVGCASGQTIRAMDNAVFWLGNDRNVYRANGYTPTRISLHPLEQAISRCNINQAFAFTYEDRGHKIYYLTFPDGETWGYDSASDEWHRRQSYGLKRWRIADVVQWNQWWVGADYVNGKLYVLDWNAQEEDGVPMERHRTLAVEADAQNPIIVNGVEIVVGTGVDSQPLELPWGLTITGDLQSGYVNDTIDFQYRIGVTYGPASVSITSGALPTGTSMDSHGHVTGQVTASGDYSWTATVTDSKGNTAHVDDSASFTIVQAAQLSDWKYLQVDDSDDADRSATDFDDSSWSTGTAPFGSWSDGTATLPAAHTFNSAFSETFATAWTTWTRLWLRRTLSLSAAPANGIKITYYMDDHFTMYVNGVDVFDSSTNPDGGTGSSFVITESNLVAGNNSIAILCHDEEPPIDGTSVVYFDMFVDGA